MKDLVVAKIGGSILRSGQGMVDSLSILNHYPQIKVVVVSATFNTTNELEEIARESISGNGEILEDLFQKLTQKHYKYIIDLGLPAHIEKKIDLIVADARKISKEIKDKNSIIPKDMDSLYAIGELLSSMLFAAFLGKTLISRTIKLCDARKIIKTDSNFKNAKPLKEEIKIAVKKEIFSNFDQNSLFIVPGFIGSNLEGDTTTLGREGSDYSAALLAEALEASELQIWKDVPGIFSGDPKIVKNAKAVPQLSFREVNKFSEKGAKILFPSALLPVMELNIPVYIGWVGDHKKGTRIAFEKNISAKLIGVARQTDFIRFELEKKNNNISAKNFFDNTKIFLDIQKVKYKSLYHDGEKICFHLPIRDGINPTALKTLEEFSIVSKFPNISLISVVGVEMEKFSGKVFEIVEELEKEGISLILTEETSDFLTFSYPARSDNKVLNQIHDKLFFQQ